VKCAGNEKDRTMVMLLGDSLGSKYSHFIVFKVRESKIEIRRQENKTFRHEFSRGMWK
ncbi:hypothetical protein PHYSODRAFT_408076, partial [Phytophthora sojae]